MPRYKADIQQQKNSLPEPIRHFIVLYCHETTSNIQYLLGFFSRDIRNMIRKCVLYTREKRYIYPSVYQQWHQEATAYFSAKIPVITREAAAAIARESLNFVDAKETSLADTTITTTSSSASNTEAQMRPSSMPPASNGSNSGDAAQPGRNPTGAMVKTPHIPKGITVTNFTVTEQKKDGLMKIDYVGVKYRHSSIADCFANRFSHSVSPDGLTFFLKVPRIDYETSRKVAVAKDEEDIDNEVMAQLRAETGDDYVNALLEQLTNSNEYETLVVGFGRRCFPLATFYKKSI